MPSATTVSVLVPVLDEAAHIEECIASLRAQDHPGVVEILVAEGGSTDGTVSILERLAAGAPPVRVVPNPHRNQSAGLNLLISLAVGDVVTRADAHTRYAADYVARSVAALEASGADLVGGPMLPEGSTPREAAIAAAMRSPVAVGRTAFRRSGASGEVDTVYLGTMRTETARRMRGYRRLPSGVAEDADLAFRIRRAGGRVVLDPSIRSSYRPRRRLRDLARQFFRYGRGKAEMLYLNGRFPSWRPLAPLLLVLGVGGTTLLGVTTGVWWPLVALAGAWLVTIGVGSVRGPRVPTTAAAIAIIHVAYGAGLLRGLVAGRRALSRIPAVGGAPPAGDATAGHLDRHPQDGQSGE